MNLLLKCVLLFYLCLFVGFPIITSARTGNNEIDKQQREIRGKITDDQNNSLAGVTIVEKGNTDNVTVSDDQGNFQLRVSINATLLIHHIGFQEYELKIKEKDTYIIQLREDAFSLDEAVVVGYGTVRKKDLTGAVSSISGDVVANRKVMALSTALQGASSGVTVSRTSGEPGSGSSIRIRGITTIGNSDPLIIVDGVPVDNIDHINPNDVENISVLKDAASASIYGSRAAAGVILITTKRGSVDRYQLTYSFEGGFEQLASAPKFVSPTRFMEMENELRWNDAGNGPNEYPTHPQNLVENYYALNTEDPNAYPITDWYDLVLRDRAPRVSHQLGFTGGTEFIRTNASLVYDKIEGLYANRSTERYNFRLNNDFTINKYLKATLDVNARRAQTVTPNSHPFSSNSSINYIPSIFAGTWSDGRYGEARTGGNIYAMVNEGGTNTTLNNQLSGKASLDLTPIPELTISAVFSPTYNFLKGERFKKEIKYYDPYDENLFAGYISGFNQTDLEETRNDSYRLLAQFFANYSKQFNGHNLTAMAGHESFTAFNETLGARREQYLLTEYPYLDIGPENYVFNSGNANENAYQSWFGRLVYSYKDRYLFQANVRRDGSSRFHQDYRWGTFPSFSGGWVVSEEPFFKKNNVISYLKVRASWGALGNERIGNYPYQSSLSFDNVLFVDGGGVVSTQSSAQRRLAVLDISWEKTESWNFGVDGFFFDNRLRLTADYFDKSTQDMLLGLEIPRYIGYPSNPDVNSGKMRTKGFDLEVGWNGRIGSDWSYAVSANLSDFTSIMGDLGGTEFLGNRIKKEGSEFDEWYGYMSDGIFQTPEEIASSPTLNNNVRPGDIKYLDISGPDGVPDGIISPEYDRVLLGGSLPRYMYGSNIQIGYKDLDFGITIQGVGKRNSLMTQNMVQPLYDNWANIPINIDDGYWSHYQSEDENMQAKYPRLTYANAANNYAMSDFWMFSGRYLRVKNILIGYTLPTDWTQKMKVQRLRLYAAANDLFTINDYPPGWDPETSGNSYPITTQFVFGASVSF